MARPKSNGPYAPLSAIYYRDDAILEVGEFAELMFVRCLAFLADAASDGFITERQMRIVVGMGLDQVPERVEALVGVGLLERIAGGFIVRSWLKWNKSTEEIGKHLKRDRERKASGKSTDSSVIPDGIQADSRDQINTEHFNTEHNTEEPLSDAEASDHGDLIPDDWRPNQTHIDKARSLHLDVKQEYHRFRKSAVDKQRRLKGPKGWNAGFTNWLRKRAEFNTQQSGSVQSKPSKEEQIVGVLEMGRRLQEQESRKELES